MKSKLVCTKCHREYTLDVPRWRCECEGLLNFDKQLAEFKVVKDDYSLWRYRHLLPIENPDSIVTLGEGLTPLLKSTLGGREVFLKLEFVSPTGSYKDRGATVLISKLNEWGVERIVEDSSGNAGAAIAAYAAALGISCEIYLPESTSDGKIKQISAYGAEVIKVMGNRDATSKEILKQAQTIYYASHTWNPLFFEGTKTMAYEIWEQLGCAMPDVLIIPVGNGTMLLGAYAGFMDLVQLGMIDSLPRLIGVQSAHCRPIYTKFYDLPPTPVTPTKAEGISIGDPVRINDILKAIHQSGGSVLVVEDAEVLRGKEELARRGIYVEFTSGTVIAGYHQALATGLITADETVILPLTGSGLKKG